MQTPVFLTAEWRYLVMLNYVVDRGLLQSRVPRGAELDFFDGKAMVSVVGFHFIHTRIFGIAFPLHSDFEEVNLRFYVRRKIDGGWRRGVVFIRELVPRRAIAFIARTVYGEPYSALPMRHSIDVSEAGVRIEYAWRRAGRWESVKAAAAGQPRDIENGSEDEFITEHYWGYTDRPKGCSEYQVEHPRWRVWHCTEAILNADIAGLYGANFVEDLSASPTSAFIAEGSPIVVRAKSPILLDAEAHLPPQRPITEKQ